MLLRHERLGKEFLISNLFFEAKKKLVYHILEKLVHGKGRERGKMRGGNFTWNSEYKKYLEVWGFFPTCTLYNKNIEYLQIHFVSSSGYCLFRRFFSGYSTAKYFCRIINNKMRFKSLKKYFAQNNGKALGHFFFKSPVLPTVLQDRLQDQNEQQCTLNS